MHRYPRRWQYIAPDYLRRRARAATNGSINSFPWGVQCDEPGGTLYTVTDSGEKKTQMKVDEAHADKQVAAGEYSEVFDHHDMKSGWQAGENLKNKVAIVFLKKLIKELKDESLREIAALKAENLELQLLLEKNGALANGEWNG